MKIPFVDLKAQYNLIKNEIDNAIEKVIENTSFIMGENVFKFESEFAKYCNKKYAVGISSGTSALRLALKAIGIKPGDEVITVPNTFIATVEAIRQLGAKVVFVDVDKDSYNIDPKKIENAITDKSKCILPIHLYGQPADIKHINEIAEKYNLKVIEDSCQAHGAEFNGEKVPINTGCFSFYPGKNLGAYGDCGAVVTNDEDIALKVSMLRDHGRKPGEKYEHTILGSNERMDAIQAAILRVKLKYLDTWIEARRKNALIYNKLLKGTDVVLPIEASYARHVYHLYVVRTKKRDELQKFLEAQEIKTIIHYPIPLHLQEACKDLDYKEGDFPITEQYSKEILSLPMYPELTDDMIKYIASVINSFIKKG